MRIWMGLLFVSSVAYAQPRETAREHHELRQDHRAIRDDQRDLERIQSARHRFERALARRDLDALAALDREVRWLIDVEQRESDRELRENRAEIRDGQRELRESDTRRALREERRELRDDRHDRNLEWVARARRSAIASEWGALEGYYNPASLGRKRALLGELVQMAREEIDRDLAERREDRHQLHWGRRHQY